MPVIDRVRFFNAVRVQPFGGTISQAQVDGCNAILDHWDGQTAETDIRWLAYMLATVFWETDRAMTPVEEYGHGAGQLYGTADPTTAKIYYGRGDVQLTWKPNYAKMGAILGVDLVDHPELPPGRRHRSVDPICRYARRRLYGRWPSAVF